MFTDVGFNAALAKSWRKFAVIGMLLSCMFLTVCGTSAASTYSQHDVYRTATETSDLVASDFTGDGISDIAVALKSTNQVLIYANDGAGSFTVYDTVLTGTPMSLASEDLDNSGSQDLIVGNANGRISYFLNANFGNFGPASGSVTVGAAGNLVFDVQGADINQDGFSDLLWIDSAKNFNTSLNDLTGNFSTTNTVVLPKVALNFVVGDLSSASGNCTDVAIGYFGFPIIQMLDNDTTCSGAMSLGAFTATAGDISGLAAADFSGDSITDIAELEGTNDTVSILKNDLSSVFTTTSTIEVDNNSFTGSSGAAYHATGDFNGDANQDVAVSNSNSYEVALLTGNGNDQLLSREIVSTTDYPKSLDLADFNGDGKEDLAVDISSTNGFEVLLSELPSSDPCVIDPASCEEPPAETATVTSTVTETATAPSVTVVSSETVTETASTTTSTTTDAVTPLSVTVSVAKRLRLRSLRVKVKANRDVTFKVSGKVRAGKSLRLRSKVKTLKAGESYVFKLKLKGSKKRRALAYLKRKRFPKVTFKVSAVTTDGLSVETYKKTKKSKVSKR